MKTIARLKDSQATEGFIDRRLDVPNFSGRNNTVTLANL